MNAQGTIPKQEAKTPGGVERTKTKRVFVPRVDILETEKDIVMVADMPGVDEKSLNITLEKGILDIHGTVEPDNPKDLSLAYAEYETGDFQRSFSLSEEVDRDNIQASIKNGVLRLSMLKAKPTSKKIAVKAA